MVVTFDLIYTLFVFEPCGHGLRTCTPTYASRSTPQPTAYTAWIYTAARARQHPWSRFPHPVGVCREDLCRMGHVGRVHGPGSPYRVVLFHRISKGQGTFEDAVWLRKKLARVGREHQVAETYLGRDDGRDRLDVVIRDGQLPKMRMANAANSDVEAH